jgi:flagellin
VGLDVSSHVASQSALDKIDTAIADVDDFRADVGAKINRLNFAIDNLTNISINTSASRSRIEDADFAKASSELARTQIIQQAATAVLAQANTDQQSVLKLLQG